MSNIAVDNEIDCSWKINDDDVYIISIYKNLLLFVSLAKTELNWFGKFWFSIICGSPR